LDWGELVEQKIQEAMAKGEFENLPGRGQPLRLEEYPFTPPEWRLAYKILADAGFAPDWIELDKEIRERLERWRRLLAWFREERDKGLASPSLRRRKEARELWQLRRQLLLEEAEVINERIELFNLKVPIKWLQRRKFKPEEEPGFGEA